MAKYYHGNLRNKLLKIANELLKEDGINSLSLRKMSQRASVSHNAPYMHFANKEAVLVAIAEESFRLLEIEVESAISQADNNARQKLLAVSEAYVRFALSHPNHIQIMFRPVDTEKYPGLVEVSQASLSKLYELVKLGQENGELGSGNTHEMTKAIWAMVHGLSVLSIAYETSILLPEKNSVEDVVSVLVNFLLDGLSTKQKI